MSQWQLRVPPDRSYEKDFSAYRKLIVDALATADSPYLRARIIQHLVRKIEGFGSLHF